MDYQNYNSIVYDNSTLTYYKFMDTISQQLFSWEKIEKVCCIWNEHQIWFVVSAVPLSMSLSDFKADLEAVYSQQKTSLEIAQQVVATPFVIPLTQSLNVW